VIAIRTAREIAILREANRIVADVLDEMARQVVPGAVTRDLDALGERLIRERGGIPSFLGIPRVSGGHVYFGGPK